MVMVDANVGEYFLLRIPSLPSQFVEILRSAFEERLPLHHAIPPDCMDQVKEAIYLASSSLYRDLFEKDESDARAAMSFARYLYRMSCRPTPYGAFSAVAVGRIAKERNLEIDPPMTAQRHLRLDQGVISSFQAKFFSLDPNNPYDFEDLQDLVVRRNSSAWLAPDGWRYAEAKRSASWTHYELSRVTDNVAVSSVMALLKERPHTIGGIVKHFKGTSNANRDEVVTFVLGLAKEQLVFLGPAVAVTGNNPVKDFISKLERLRFKSEESQVLVAAQAQIDRLDQSREPIAVSEYEKIVSVVTKVEPTADRSKIVQMDLSLGTSGLTVDKKVVDEILETLGEVAPIVSRSRFGLGDFARRFEARYGAQRVRLLEAIDDDIGIGFGASSKVSTPLVSGLMPKNSGVARVSLGDFDIYTLGQAQLAAIEGRSTLELETNDIQKFPPGHGFPTSYAIMGSLYSEEEGGHRFEISGIFGPPAGVLLGRFGILSETLTSSIRDAYADLEASDHVVAEVIHRPEGRVGNVIVRPVFTDYEISYMGEGGVSAEAVIHAYDLDIAIESGVVKLYQRSTGRRVLPQMSNAHNFNNSLNLPVYRFLCSLARQEQPTVGWTWGSAAAYLPWLPAVRYRNVLLSRERWIIYPVEVRRLKANGISALNELREKRRLPAEVRLVEGDNFLDLNIDRSLDAELLLDAARRQSSLTLERCPEVGAVVHDDSGNTYHNEVIFQVKETARQVSQVSSLSTTQSCRANFRPGGNWLYAKIYCGHTMADQWLSERFEQLSEYVSELGCGPVFFIRYGEGGNHLRIRIKGEPSVLWNQIRTALEDSFSDFFVNRMAPIIEYSTYFPEYDRYGGSSGMAICEKIFGHDSLSAARGLATFVKTSDRETRRWRFALQSVVGLVGAITDDFGEATRVIASLRDNYLAEFGFEAHHLDPIFRKHRSALACFLAQEVEEEWITLLDQRNVQISSEWRGFHDKPVNDELLSIQHSLIHMTVNRLMPELARLNEMALLHCVDKGFKSIIARARMGKPASR